MRLTRRFFVVRAFALLASALAFGRDAAARPVYQFVDLTPAGPSDSIVTGVRGTGHQAGLARYGPQSSGKYHAMLWSGTGASAIDIHPAGFDQSQVESTAGGTQVGVGFNGPNSALIAHAVVWHGSASTAVDLHPGPQWHSSGVGDTDGVHHFGHALLDTPRERHAMLWTGVNPTPQDYHPAGYSHSAGTAIGDGQLVGVGDRVGSSGQHALLWNGAPNAVVDLHPADALWSVPRGVAHGEQVGEVFFTTPNRFHAGLWHGSVASFVDLNPAGFDNSAAYQTNGATQVGYARIGNISHAMAWSGTAASALDLQAFVPSTYMQSEARGIDEFGNIVGAAYTDNGQRHAAMWVLVPEPATLAYLMPILATMVRRRRL